MSFVLVIDDDEEFREVLGAALTLEGFQVEFAANGREALERLTATSERPSALVLDLMMPVMNGWQFLDVKEQSPPLQPIPTVVVSAARSGPPLPRSVAVLPKPLDLEDLLAFLRRASLGADVN